MSGRKKKKRVKGGPTVSPSPSTTAVPCVATGWSPLHRLATWFGKLGSKAQLAIILALIGGISTIVTTVVTAGGPIIAAILNRPADDSKRTPPTPPPSISVNVIITQGTTNSITIDRTNGVKLKVNTPERIQKLPNDRNGELKSSIADDFAGYDKVMARWREFAFPIVTNVVETELAMNPLKPLDRGLLIRRYFADIQAPINLYLGSTNFSHAFRQRYNQWVQLPDRQQVQNGLLELASAWDEKIANGTIPSDPTTRKANFETVKTLLLRDAHGIIEGSIANAESDFMTWTATNSIATYVRLYSQ